MPEFSEISTELAKPEIVEQVISDEKLFPVFSEAIQKKGFQILDQKGRDELLKNYKESELKSAIDEETRNLHSYYDKDLKEVYGESDLIKPKEGETKTYHINKRLHQENLRKIKELEEKVAKGDHKEFYETKLSEAEKKYQLAIEQEQNKFKELEQKFLGTQKETSFVEAYSPIRNKIDPKKIEVFGEELFKDLENSVKSEITKNSVMHEGQFVLTNPDGSVMKDNHTFKPVLVADYLQKKFGNLMKKEDPGGGGTGEGGTKAIDPSKVTVENFDTKGAQNKSDLIDALTAAGLSPGTPSFTEIYNHYSKEFK